MSKLLEAIREEIEAEGPMGFEAFMDRALYSPDGGYYAGGPGIGREGDFYTSVSVGGLFGELLAEQVAEVWERMGRPKAFDLVEQGAHEGQLAADVLGALRRRHEELFKAVRYRIVEPLPDLRERQRERFAECGFEAVAWCERLEDLGEVAGVYFCNELVDAFPFRRMRFEEGRWRELRVALDREGALCWEAGGDGASAVAEESSVLQGGKFEEGYVTEVRPAVEAWMESLSGVLRKGAALIVDYGYEEEEYYEEGRREGTLRCYEGHRAFDDPLVNVGGQDIAPAHVNFTRLASEAVKRGFEVEGPADQHHFLVSVSRALLEEREGVSDPVFARQFQTLTHPGLMGRSFKGARFEEGFAGWGDAGVLHLVHGPWTV